MNMKRVLVIVLCILTTAFMSACAQVELVADTVPAVSTAPITTPPPTTVPSTTQGEPVNEDVELLFWEADLSGDRDLDNSIITGADATRGHYIEGLPISMFTKTGAQLTLEVSTNKGILAGGRRDITLDGEFVEREKEGEYGKSAVIQSERTIYWQCYDWHAESGKNKLMFEPEYNLSNEDIFIEVVVKQDDHIVGYVVIEILFDGEPFYTYNAILLTSEYFPPKDGVYQEVSEYYIRQQMELAKQGRERLK